MYMLRRKHHDSLCVARSSTSNCSQTCCYVQGKTLTNSVKQIFTDFQAAAEKFQKLNYDAMNIDATQFSADFASFCAFIRELERRLGAVIAQVRRWHHSIPAAQYHPGAMQCRLVYAC